MYNILSMLSALVCLVALLTSSGCAPANMVEGHPAAGASDNLEVTITGTITYQSIEGGFYALLGKDGQKFMPLNLPEDYQEDGLKVEIRALPRHDVMGIHMFGENIEILEIQQRN